MERKVLSGFNIVIRPVPRIILSALHFFYILPVFFSCPNDHILEPKGNAFRDHQCIFDNKVKRIDKEKDTKPNEDENNPIDNSLPVVTEQNPGTNIYICAQQTSSRLSETELKFLTASRAFVSCRQDEMDSGWHCRRRGDAGRSLRHRISDYVCSCTAQNREAQN